MEEIMEYLRGFIFFCCLFFYSNAASIPEALKPTSLNQKLRIVINRIDPQAFPDLELEITVSDPTGMTLESLKRKNLKIYESKKLISDYSMEISNDPLEIALVLDDSGSMHDQVSPLVQAVSKFIRLLGKRDRATIISFSDRVKTLHGGSTDKRGLIRSLKKLKGYGPTALYDAIVKAADSLPAMQKTAIILLSDGIDQNRENTRAQSAHSAVEAITQVVNKRIPILVIGLGRRINRMELMDFARLSKGAFYYAPSARQLEDLYASIARNLKSDVRIKYVSPDERKDAAYRSVKIEVRSGSLEGKAKGSYFSPGRFVLESLPFGFDARDTKQHHGSRLRFNLVDERRVRRSGGKEFLQRWIERLGK
jgi:VWFA-related protein